MRITIAQRLKPFSHTPGTVLLIPKTTWEATIFPTKLVFRSLSDLQAKPFELAFSFQGPWKDFTLMQDLEKQRVEVFGQSKGGFVRYFIQVKEGRLGIYFEKTPGHSCFFSDQTIKVSAKEWLELPLPVEQNFQEPAQERLFLGVDKAQDWDLIQRRSDLKEIFPLWLKLASQIPKIKEVKNKIGALQLIDECQEIIKNKDKKMLYQAFLNLFQAGFEGILSPRSRDVHYWGLIPNLDKPIDQSPLAILHEGSHLIRSLFFEEDDNHFQLLPCLPIEFDSGRFTGIQTKQGDILHLEWSKKLLQKVIITAKETRSIKFSLQSALKNYRLRRTLSDRGLKVQKNDSLQLEAGKMLYLDRFEK